MDVNPGLILAMWTAGMAGGGAVVALWRIVGPGFSWLVAAVVALFGLGAAYFEGGALGYVAVALAVLAGLLARNAWAAVVLFGASAVGFLVVALENSDLVPALSGSLFLGAITSVMMLGHWYLVDPRLPRWALQRLDVAAGAGLLTEFVSMVLAGALDWVPSDAIIGWTFIVLSLMTFLLVIAVWYSLLEPSYTGVMAATGLSYLAVLTAFGVAVLGRLLAFGTS